MIFSAKITELTARVRELEGQLNAANGNVQSLGGEKAELERQLSDATAKLEGAVTAADHQAAIEAKDGELATLRGQLETAQKDTKGKIEAGVVEGIAKAGFPAVRRDPQAVDTLTKSDGKGAGTPAQRLSATIKIAGPGGSN